MERRVLALTFAGVVAAWACGSPPPAQNPGEPAASVRATAEVPKPEAGPAAPGPEQPPETAKAEPDPPPVIKLLAAGRAPQQKLRYKLSAGSAQKLNLRTTTKVNGASMQLPAIVSDWPVDITVDEVQANGAAKFHYSMGPMKLNLGGGQAGLAQALGGLTGGMTDKSFEGAGSMDDRGFIQEGPREQPAPQEDSQGGDVLGGATAPAPSLTESADPFPEEAVGAGARWEVRSRRSEAGLVIEKVSTYELVSVKAGVLKTKLTRTESPVSDPDRPTKLDADGGDAPKKQESRGELTFRLDQPYPTGYLTMSGVLSVPGLANVSVDSKVEIKPR